ADTNPAADLGLAAGAGAGLEKGAPNAYVVPAPVAGMLGVSKTTGGLAAYADILAVLQGVQEYETGDGDTAKFVPKAADGAGDPLRYFTNRKLQGTFQPFFPDFTNRPLWDVL